MIRLYKAGERSFLDNGIGILHDALTCSVTEEIGNSFTLSMEYPLNGHYISSIKVGNVLTAKPNPFASQVEPFVIDQVSIPLNGRISIHAKHIAITDLESFVVYPFEDDPTNVNYISQQSGAINLYNANDIIGILKYACQKAIDGKGGASTAVDSKIIFDVSRINQTYADVMTMKNGAATYLYSPDRYEKTVECYRSDDPTIKKKIEKKYKRYTEIFAVRNVPQQKYLGETKDLNLAQIVGHYVQNEQGVYEFSSKFEIKESSSSPYTWIYDCGTSQAPNYPWVAGKKLSLQVSTDGGEDIRALFKLDCTNVDTLFSYMGTRIDDDSRWKETDATFQNFAQSFQCDYQFTYDYDEEKSKVIMYGHRDGSVYTLSPAPFSIRYASNMTDMTEQTDWTSVYSHIFPYYGSGDDIVLLAQRPYSWYKSLADYSDYPICNADDQTDTVGNLIAIPGSPLTEMKILPVDLSDEFYDATKEKTEPDPTQLYQKAVEYIISNMYKLATPKISLTVSFAQLSKSASMSKYEAFDKVVVGDDATVMHPDAGISVAARVYSMVYDAISGKYTSMTVGNCRQRTFMEGLVSSGKRGIDNEKVGIRLGSNSVIKSQNVYYLKHTRTTQKYIPSETTPPEPYLDKYGVNEWVTESDGDENEWSTVPCRVPEVVEKYQNNAVLVQSYDIIGEHTSGSEYEEDGNISYYTFGKSSTKNSVSDTWKMFVSGHNYQYCYRVADSGSEMRFFNAATVPSGGVTYKLNDLINEGLPTALATAINSGLFKIGDRFHSGLNWNLYSYWHAIQRKYINGAIRTEEIAIDDSLNRQSIDSQDLYYYKTNEPPVVQNASPRRLMVSPLMATSSNDDSYPSAPTTWVENATPDPNVWTRQKPSPDATLGGTYYICKQSLNVDGSLSGVVRTDAGREFWKSQTAYIEWTNSGTPSKPTVWIDTTLPTTGNHIANTWYNSVMELKHDGIRYYCEQTLFTDNTFENGEVFVDGGGGFVAVQNIYKRITCSNAPALPNEWINDSTPGINKWYTSAEKQTYTPDYYTWSAKQYRKSNGEAICKDLDLVILGLDDIQTIFFRSATNSSPTAPTTWVTLSTESSEQWTQYCMKPVSLYPYVWYTSQKKYSDGTVSVGTYQTAGLSDYISETQSIRYRKTTSGAPSIESLEWITQTSSTVTNEWTRFVLQPESGNHVWEIEQQKHLKSDGSTYLTYSPTSPCLINYIITVQQTLFYVTKSGKPNPPSTWVTQVDCVPNAWFDDYTKIPSSPPIDWTIYSSGDTWKNYAFYRCIQNGDQKDGEITSFSSTKVQQIFFSEVTALAYAEVFNRDSSVVPPEPSAPTSYSQIYNAESTPTSGRWYNNIPVKVLKKEGYKNIKYYSVSYLYGQNDIGVSYFIPSTVESRDTENMMVNWCAENDDTKIDGSAIYTENLYARNVKVYRQGDDGETIFWADGNDNAINPLTGQAGRFIQIGNYYVNPETGGLIGVYSNDSTQSLQIRHKIYGYYTALFPSRLYIHNVINGSIKSVNYTYNGIHFHGGQPAHISASGGLTLAGPLTFSGKFFPGSSIVYNSKPEWTSDDVGRVIFVKEQNS